MVRRSARPDPRSKSPMAPARKHIAWWSLPLLLAAAPPVWADGPPPDLPRYDVDVTLDVHQHVVTVKQRVTWTNRGRTPVGEVVFNAHACYAIPDKDVGLLAKMAEILRLSPTESLNFDGPALRMQGVTLLAHGDKPFCAQKAPVGPVCAGQSAGYFFS